MSWYGSHPEISKEEARKMLPASACRMCVYWVRVHPQHPWTAVKISCTRCSGKQLRPVTK